MKNFAKYNAKKAAIPPANNIVARKIINVFRSIVVNNSLIANTAPFLALLIVYNETKETAMFTVLMLPIRIKKEYVESFPMIWEPKIAACAGPRPGKKLTKLPEKVPATKALIFSNLGIFIVSVMRCFGISTLLAKSANVKRTNLAFPFCGLWSHI